MAFSVQFNRQTCTFSYLPTNVHLMRKVAVNFDIFWVSVRSFEKKLHNHIFTYEKEHYGVNLGFFSLLLFKGRHLSKMFS